MKIRLLLFLLLGFASQNLLAQTSENPFYSNGKIYVVVSVLSIIFIGIIIFLIRIDRRLTKMEKEIKDKEN